MASCDGPEQTRDGLIQPAHPGVGLAQHAMRPHEPRVDRDDLLQVIDRLLGAAQRHQHGSQAEVRE
jgi:hypothetical protein